MPRLKQAIDMIQEMGVALDNVKIGNKEFQVIVLNAVEAKYQEIKKRGKKPQSGGASPAAAQDVAASTVDKRPKPFDLFKNFGGGPGNAKS